MVLFLQLVYIHLTPEKYLTKFLEHLIPIAENALAESLWKNRFALNKCNVRKRRLLLNYTRSSSSESEEDPEPDKYSVDENHNRSLKAEEVEYV